MSERRHRDEKGFATIWSVSILLLISAATGWALLWIMAESARHATERAADSTALAAASAALRGLATQDESDPCAAARVTAMHSGAQLVACDCAPLDCTISVRHPFPLLGPLEASSRAGPVGEASGAGRGGNGGSDGGSEGGDGDSDEGGSGTGTGSGDGDGGGAGS